MRLGLGFVVLFALGARGEVIDASASGFLVRRVVTIGVSPSEVYQGITDISKWWESAHTFSGNARNLSLGAKAGGCFCESLPPDGEVRHMTVVYAAPGKLLRMTGALGPMQSAGVSGTMTFELKPAESGTEVTLSYSVGGYFQGGLASMAGPVDSVLKAQLAGLKAFLERK
jgi:uncharacterized protein YndB with AHSA1/START domain